MKSQFTEKHILVGVSSWSYGCAAVSVFLLFFIVLLRMDCMGFLQRWPSKEIGLRELFLQMEAHLSVLPDASRDSA